MPGKAPSKKPAKSKSKKLKAELNVDNLNLLLKSAPQPKKSHEEISGLESGILNTKTIDTSRLQDLWEDISWSEAPSLNKIAIAPSFVTSGTEIRRTQTPETELNPNDSDPFKYQIGGGSSKDEVKYIATTQIRAAPQFIDVKEVGRVKEQEFNQQAFFAESSEIGQRGFVSSGVEKYAMPERFDTEKAGRKDPLKKDDLKYEFKQSGA